MGLYNDYIRCEICEEWGGGCGCLKEYEREDYEPKRAEPSGANRGLDTRLRQRDCE